MIYTSYKDILKDLEYSKIIFDGNFSLYTMRRYGDEAHYHPLLENKVLDNLKKEWFDHIKEKYNQSKNTNTSLGKFLKKFPLEFKEFCCLMDLLNRGTGRFSLFDEDEDDREENPFVKHKVRYESSQLRRLKLVYRIINPLRPFKTTYEVSYKAQLSLKNRKYTSEYEQLDMALEEESKISSPESLNSLYYSINPKFTLNDLIVSDKVKSNLMTAISRDKQKDKIFKNWGFKNVIEYGKGTTLNFRGPPGTGKTMAAHVIAKELGKKLLIVRYDQIKNMWVGETEKHIQRIFTLASKKNAVLFFDEADAIALNRATLEHSWEMSQVNTLLKELERFDGVCIFATNFSSKYDPAFERRLTMHIDFLMPNKEQCRQILDKLLPRKSREKNLDINSLEIEGFSGGDIKNIVLNAAGIAAKNNADKISINHIKEAIAMVNVSNKSYCRNLYLG